MFVTDALTRSRTEQTCIRDRSNRAHIEQTQVHVALGPREDVGHGAGDRHGAPEGRKRAGQEQDVEAPVLRRRDRCLEVGYHGRGVWGVRKE